MRLSTESIVEKTQWIDMLEQVRSNVFCYTFRCAVVNFFMHCHQCALSGMKINPSETILHFV